MVESITFNTEDAKLIVAFEDGTSKEYTKADKYLYILDYPNRAADVIAMGWN